MSWLFDFPHSLAFPSRKANTFHDQATSTASPTTPAPPPGSSSRRDARSRPSRAWMVLFPLRRDDQLLELFYGVWGGGQRRFPLVGHDGDSKRWEREAERGRSGKGAK